MKTGTFLKLLAAFAIILWSMSSAKPQSEILTNAEIIEMSGVGIGKEIILQKIKSSAGNYDLTVKGLIELKKGGVSDEVISVLQEISLTKRPKISNETKADETNQTGSAQTNKPEAQNFSESQPVPDKNAKYKTPAQLLREAKTVAFNKSSVYPARQDLESSLLKRERRDKWEKFGLVITRYKEEADLIVEIGREFLTHYNFRVIDVKSGRVIAASGVTSLGGSLAGNIADKLIKRLNEVLANEEK